MDRWIAMLSPILLLALTGSAPGDQPGKDAMKDVANDSNAFAFNLYGKLRSKPGNLFFSPDSISIALAMTYDGARGDTAKQMANTLHFQQDPQALNDGFGALLKHFNGEGRKRAYELHVANALWGQQGHEFLPAFLATTRDHYGAGLRFVDFQNNPEAARGTINAWVEKETRDKIKDLLRSGTIQTSTRLVLTNAVYFKGTWQRPFRKNLTHEAPFHVSADREVRVPMMHQDGQYRYFHDVGMQMLEMPYKGDDLSMVILLPRRNDGLDELEHRLSAKHLTGWLNQARPTMVDVSLPRFRLTQQFELGDTLVGMGMPSAFGAAADFSGMDGKKDLFLSAVVHKAFVDVNEEGTEAAAATAVVVRAMAVRISERFQADHPFIFLIRDKQSGSILFLGRVTNPQS